MLICGCSINNWLGYFVFYLGVGVTLVIVGFILNEVQYSTAQKATLSYTVHHDTHSCS